MKNSSSVILVIIIICLLLIGLWIILANRETPIDTGIYNEGKRVVDNVKNNIDEMDNKESKTNNEDGSVYNIRSPEEALEIFKEIDNVRLGLENKLEEYGVRIANETEKYYEIVVEKGEELVGNFAMTKDGKEIFSVKDNTYSPIK